MDTFNLSIKEKNEAKQNGFVLLGITGAGKSTLLNALYGQDLAKVDRNFQSTTKESSIYYYKLQNGKCISIIDTPGLSDSTKIINSNYDDILLKDIIEIISQENRQIKGILVLLIFKMKDLMQMNKKL